MGETPFELFIVPSGDLTEGVIIGSVDGHPVSLDVGRDEPSVPVTVQGSNTGPPALLGSDRGNRRLLFVFLRSNVDRSWRLTVCLGRYLATSRLFEPQRSSGPLRRHHCLNPRFLPLAPSTSRAQSRASRSFYHSSPGKTPLNRPSPSSHTKSPMSSSSLPSHGPLPISTIPTTRSPVYVPLPR